MTAYITCPHCGTPQRHGASRCVYCKAPLQTSPGARPQPTGKNNYLPLILIGGGLALAFVGIVGLVCVLAGLAGAGGMMSTADRIWPSPTASQVAIVPALPATSTTALTHIATSTVAPTRRAPATTRPATARPTTARQSVPPTPVDTRNPLLFMDEFDDNRNEWSLTYGWLESGELHIHTTEQGKSWLSVCSRAGEFDTFSYEVQARKVEGNNGAGYGLIFRASRDNRELYAFLVNGMGSYILSKWDHNKWVHVVPWKGSSAVRGGNSGNKLVVSCYENFFDILVNDQVVISHAVDDFRSNGRIGLLVSYGAHVAFDSVRVWRR